MINHEFMTSLSVVVWVVAVFIYLGACAFEIHDSDLYEEVRWWTWPGVLFLSLITILSVLSIVIAIGGAIIYPFIRLFMHFFTPQ